MARIRLRCARQLVIEQAIHQGAVRILDELRGLQVALRRSIALKKQARRELIHRRQHLTNPTARGGVFPLRIHRLMPLRECENDMGGRFTKRPFRDSQCRFHLSSVFSLACASMAGPAMPVWKSPGRTGATLFEALVREWDGVGLHKPRTAPWGSLPSKVSLRTISVNDVRHFIQRTYGFLEGVLPPIMPLGKKQISLALRGVSGRLAPTGLRPLSEPAILVSPQAAGPAVPEREIGPGTGSGVLWHARSLEMAACPAKL